MNLKSLTEFIRDELTYKDLKVVKYYPLGENWIQLIFTNIKFDQYLLGELIKIERYENWVIKKRNDKLKEILND